MCVSLIAKMHFKCTCELLTLDSEGCSIVSMYKRRTDLEQIRSRINNNLIAGHSGLVDLCQLPMYKHS